MDKLYEIIDQVFLSLKILGVIGNGLVLILFSRRCFRKLSVTTYIRAMAVASLCENTHWIILKYLDIPFHTSNFCCKFINFIMRYFTPLAVWFEVAAAFDRLLTIVYPTRFQFIKTLKFQFLIILLVIIYNLGFYSKTFFDFFLKTFYRGRQKIPYSVCLSEKNASFEQANFISSTALPFILMFVLSLVTFCGVLRAHNRAKRLFLSTMTAHQVRVHQRDLKFGITMIILNILFLVLNTPFRLTYIVDFNPFDSYRQTFFFTIFQYGIFFLLHLYFSINFFVHLAVNNLVRKEFFKMIKCLFRRCFFCFRNSSM